MLCLCLCVHRIIYHHNLENIVERKVIIHDSSNRLHHYLFFFFSFKSLTSSVDYKIRFPESGENVYICTNTQMYKHTNRITTAKIGADTVNCLFMGVIKLTINVEVAE